MLNNIINIGFDCCGCGSCYHVCGKNAISLKANEEGFLYPSVNINCVECGVCLRVCPQVKEMHSTTLQKAFIALTKDVEVKKHSASGGIFGTISKFLLMRENCNVCGATFIDGTIKHIITQDLKKLQRIQGSKYVQSSLNNTFPRLQVLLNEHSNQVLFCGTPCQVAALYTYLGKRPTNLYTLDLICHGVPSPKFFDKNIRHYCEDIEKLNDVRFRWRNPQYATAKSVFFLSVEKKLKTEIYSSNYDPYFATFMRGESLRYSCYQCHYANLSRIGDITIGDCDSAKCYSDFYPDESKSTVIVNTFKGEELWNLVKDLFFYTDLNLSKEAEVNHQLRYPFVMPQNRIQIYKDVDALSYRQFRKKYASPTSLQQKVLFVLQTYFPMLYKRIVGKVK